MTDTQESNGGENLALEAHGLTKSYGSRHALRSVDLVVRPGRLHGLLGPNGAGKTTLMRIVLGLARPDTGTLRVLGRDRISPRRLPDGVAGFVETPGFYPYLSARRNLMLLSQLDGGGPATPAIGPLLERAGLGPHADANVAGYSAGMRQRLALCAALLRAPLLLLLDEPTGSLDPAGARDVRSMIQALSEAGTAVVLSSHDMVEVDDLCDELTVLARGRVAFAGPTSDLRRQAAGAVYRLHTSNDHETHRLAAGRSGLRTVLAAGEGGLDVWADVAALDAYVIALGCAGIAVRTLERREEPLEALFLQLTNAS